MLGIEGAAAVKREAGIKKAKLFSFNTLHGLNTLTGSEKGKLTK